MRLRDLMARGIKWEGTDGDTKFLKITGSAQNESAEALFDV